MHKEVLSHFDKPYLPMIALSIFLISFLAYTYWTFKKENKLKYEHISKIPLEDGE